MNLATIPTNRTRPTIRTTTEPDAGERQETTEGEDEESQQSAAEELHGARATADAAEMEQTDRSDMDEYDADDLDSERSRMTAMSPGGRSFPLPAPATIIFTRSTPISLMRKFAAEDLCDTDELTRLRNYLDKQLSNLQGVVARLANRLQRRLMAQQNRSWDFDLEEGVLDAARLVPHRHRSACIRFPSRWNRTRNSATPL